MDQFSQIRFGFSTVNDGNMSYRFGDQASVDTNRKQWLSSYDLKPDDFAGIRVQTSDTIIVADEKHKGLGMHTLEDAVECDAMISSQPGMGLFLMIADCLPILIYDYNTSTIGIVHCGWQGTDLNLVQKTIEKMIQLYDSKPQDLFVQIGPGIKRDSYKFENPSQANDSRWHPHLHKDSEGMTAIDILSFNQAQLLESGVKSENIIASDVDTATDTTYFSHYRSTKTGETEGRIAAFIYLES